MSEKNLFRLHLIVIVMVFLMAGFCAGRLLGFVRGGSLRSGCSSGATGVSTRDTRGASPSQGVDSRLREVDDSIRAAGAGITEAEDHLSIVEDRLWSLVDNYDNQPTE